MKIEVITKIVPEHEKTETIFICSYCSKRDTNQNKIRACEEAHWRESRERRIKEIQEKCEHEMHISVDIDDCTPGNEEIWSKRECTLMLYCPKCELYDFVEFEPDKYIDLKALYKKVKEDKG